MSLNSPVNVVSFKYVKQTKISRAIKIHNTNNTTNTHFYHIDLNYMRFENLLFSSVHLSLHECSNVQNIQPTDAYSYFVAAVTLGLPINSHVPKALISTSHWLRREGLTVGICLNVVCKVHCPSGSSLLCSDQQNDVSLGAGASVVHCRVLLRGTVDGYSKAYK